MQKQCEDNFYTTFSSALMLQDYHDTQAKNSRWYRCYVNELQVEPLDSNSPSIVILRSSLPVSRKTLSQIQWKSGHCHTGRWAILSRSYDSL